MTTEPRVKTHIDIHDRSVREHWSHHFGISDERLRKAVRMVGTRASSVAAYLAQCPRSCDIRPSGMKRSGFGP